MLTKTMKLVSIAALLLAALFWSYASRTELPLRFLVGLSAFLVALQAVRARKYIWAGGFFAVMVLFNPFVAVMTLSGKLSLFVVLATAAPFAVSLRALRTQPLASIPSITGRTPGSLSL
jgi:hypothetical protein